MTCDFAERAYSGCGLDYRIIVVRLLCNRHRPCGLKAPPNLLSGEYLWVWTDHSYPSSTEIKNQWSYRLPHFLYTFMTFTGTNYLPPSIWKDFALRHSIFRTLVCIMCIKKQQNTHKSRDIFLLWCFQLHVSAGNPSIFRMTFLLQEYGVIKRVKLLHSIETRVVIG